MPGGTLEILLQTGTCVQQAVMTHDLHLASFQKGDHICFVYRDTEEQLSTAAPFVQVGLARGERCLCVLPKAGLDGLFSWLDDHGVDTRKALARGALQAVTPEEAYLKGNGFDRHQMVKLLDDAMRESLRLGFSGFRGTGDLSWAVSDANACGQLAEYEAMLDRYYPGTKQLGICMYDANLFDSAQLNRLIDAHRLALAVPSPTKRAIRIRNGKAFGEVIFDRQLAQVFHYTVQKNGTKELFNLGQESTLTAAIDAVEASLRALSRARA